ncbi:ChrR family anti-sigma-E factor [Chachezhania antarctica]|uniref:ChrR family anti-sigma-E factor n=1 Tax=Chachezhania antarctica TaxID=2340860 RepID=UPI001F09173D|nr:ChrR family anti-sigma-E factor [Chachezhania antarctica]
MKPDIKHHVPDDLLMAYSAGALPEAYSLAIATHLSLCDTCRAAAESYDAVGGAVLEDAPEGAATMSMDSLAQTLARLKASEPREAVRPARPRSIFPGPLADYVGTSLDDIRWRPIGMGAKQMVIRTSPTASARLLYIPSGVGVPDHTHGGKELTVILDGAYSDETGRYGPGDIAYGDDELHHAPIAEDGGPCICLAVTDAPLRFKTIIPRLLQPFLGI